MIEHEYAALEYLRQHGLDPGSIKWTGKWVSFRSPGQTRGKSASYRAFADHPANVSFRDFRTGVEGRWFATRNGKPDDLDPEVWAEMQREDRRIIAEKKAAAKAERDTEAAAVAEECQKRFQEAMEPLPDHPYLVKKGIENPIGVKQDKAGHLLIPVKSLEKGSPIVSLQTIDKKGTKLFVEGGRTAGGRTTIGTGAFNREGTLYITEGWATGWSIHQATQCPVIVAFSCSNLKAIASHMRNKYEKATIIIAADNDRWSESHLGPNPGVAHARKAAAAINGLVAIPDFTDLETKPTDFNDLMLLEGADAVRKWLDPAVAHHAVIFHATVPQAPEDVFKGEWGATPAEEFTPPDLAAQEEAGVWTANKHFRCLGYDHDTYHYLPREKGQLTFLSPSAHDRKQLNTLAPLSWWEAAFPGSKGGCNWSAAADALFRASHKAGVFVKENLRGRGCWTVEDKNGKVGVLLHLGDRILAPGAKKFVDPEEYHCPEGRIYERQKRLAGPSATKAMDLTGTEEILGLFNDLLWHDESSGRLAAGWTVMAPICGALSWRPHIWITGGAGSGKTTVLQSLVQPCLGDMRFYFEGNSTEPGIRHRIRSDAIPVLYDEAERNDVRAEPRIQAIISLARSASSTDDNAEIAKGNPQGGVLSYNCRSMFCMASIGGALKGQQDRQRIALLQMRSKANVGPGEKEKHWRAYSPRLNAMNPTKGRELIARTLQWLRDGRMMETLETFKLAASTVLGDARPGDQYGTLYAGAWTLMSDEPPDAAEAREFMGAEDLTHYAEDQDPEGLRALHILLQKQERTDTSNGVKTFSVGQLVGIANGDLSGGITMEEASNKLKTLGLRVEIYNGNRVILVADTSDWVKHALIDTPYSNITATLRTLPHTERTGIQRFYSGLVSRTTAVPLALLDK